MRNEETGYPKAPCAGVLRPTTPYFGVLPLSDSDL